MAANAYALANGTSLSTPLVAGCAALLLEARPDWRPEDVRNALRATASHADSPDNDYGWGIPDVLAAMYFNNGEPATRYVLEIEKIYPNPFRAGNSPQIVIKWALATRSAVRLDIYNLLGQHIINLYARPSKPAGSGMVSWTGVDAEGRYVPTGVYFVRMIAGQDMTVKRITVQH
jgi:subtilisin family serine protease